MTNRWTGSVLISAASVLFAVAIYSFAAWQLPPALSDWAWPARLGTAVLATYVFGASVTCPLWKR